jgi:RHS repeat-associated protein
LGTPRMVVDRTGSLTGVTRHDYLPFGEEIQAGVGGRTISQGYSQFNGVRQRYTGAERDDETGLDFMQARYYANPQGRFTSPDPLLYPARSMIRKRGIVMLIRSTIRFGTLIF